MPKNKLYKFRCTEILCNMLVRSDKWNDHCKKKHVTKFKRSGTSEIGKVIVEIRGSGGQWERYTSDAATDRKSDPSTSQNITEISKDEPMMEMTKKLVPEESSMNRDDVEDQSENCEKIDEISSVIEFQSGEREPVSVGDLPMLSRDPCDYASKKLTSEIINFLLSKRSEMTSAIGDNHKCATWKYKTLPDGTQQLRSWLVYSEKKEALYCLHCLIFGSPNLTTIGNSKAFGINGYSDWKNAARGISSHENSKYHEESDLSLIRWNAGKNRLDKKIAEMHNYWVSHHRAVVSVVIDCIRYLTQEMMAFRNSDDTKGKLVNLFKLLAKYNPDAAAYLEKWQKSKVEKKRMRINFLAYDSIFNLVQIMKDLVMKEICERIAKNGGKFSIIVDSTQDASKMESTVLLTRYIEDIQNTSSLPLPIPVERLIGIFTSIETTGKQLHLEVMKILNNYNLVGLNKNNIIGQSYDGAGNMSGCTKGMSTLIQKECPMALYIWCHAHRFSLVIEKTVENCQAVKNFFGILEELHTFMNGHRPHGLFVEILKGNSKDKNLHKRRLKRVFTTRWSSKHASCTTLNACFPEVVQCLHEIAKDKSMTKETITAANGLKTKISSFEFIASLQICLKIFNVLAPVTTILQGKLMDFGSATTIIEQTSEKLRKLRSDNAWEKLKIEISEMAYELGIKEKVKRIIHRKRFFDEMGLDYCRQDIFSTLKIEFYYMMIDSLLMQMNERFSDNTFEIIKEMLMFCHENLITGNQTRAEKLCSNYKLDVDKVEGELEQFKKLYQEMEADIDVSDLTEKISKKNQTPKELEIETPKTCDNLEEDEGQGEETNHSEDEERGEETNNLEVDSDEDEDIANPDENILVKGFIKPFRLLRQLSKFEHLTVLYRILLSLAVTSCSAERAFSKQKIIKNPLRSCMLDQWMNNMMILASERDILEEIPNEAIVNLLGEKSSAYAVLLKK